MTGRRQLTLALRVAVVPVVLAALATGVQAGPPVVPNGTYPVTEFIMTGASDFTPGWELSQEASGALTISGSSVALEIDYKVKATNKEGFLGGVTHIVGSGTYDAAAGDIKNGTLSVNTQGTSSMADGANYYDAYTGTFEALVMDSGEISGSGRYGLAGSQDDGEFHFKAPVGGATTAAPTTVSAHIAMYPEGAKPGERITISARVTDADGNKLTDAELVWNVGSWGGNVNPSFVWDGNEIKVELIVIYENAEYRFNKVMPAYGQAPTVDEGATASDDVQPVGPVPGMGGAGQVPGPDTTTEAIIGAVLPGLVAVLMGLLSGPITTKAPPVAPPRGPRAPAKPKEPEEPTESKEPQETEEDREKKRLEKARAGGDALKAKLDHLKKRAERDGNQDLKDWVDKTREDAIKPDGTIDPDKLKEAQDGLREALNLPLTEGEKSHQMKEIEGAVSDFKATRDTLVQTGGEFVKGTKAFFGGIAAIPGMIVDGGKVIFTTIRDLKYFKRGLDERTKAWIETNASEESEAIGKALHEGRVLDALGNMIKMEWKAAKDLFSGPWKFVKENILPIDEVTCWTDPNSSWEECAWSIPSGIAKTLSIMMGFEAGRTTLRTPVLGTETSSPLIGTADKITKAGTKAIGKTKGKWQQMTGPANPKPPPKIPAPRLSGRLGKLRTAVEDAFNTRDDVERARKIKELYKNGGMKQLGKLEEAGGMTPQQIDEFNRVITETVDEAVDTATSNAVRDFKKTTGVTIEEAVVVDSGSSAGGASRAPVTDADATHSFTFKQDEVAECAAKRGISHSAATTELEEMAIKRINQSVADKLDDSGLARTDVDHKSYSGMGTGSGEADAYARGVVEQRTVASGKATSYKPDGKGGVTSRKISGRAAVDHNQMAQAQGHGTKVGDARVGLSAKQQVVNQQVTAVSKPDLTVQGAAKAVGRTNRQVTALGKPMNKDLVELAEAIDNARNNTEVINEALRAKGMTREGFRQAVREAVGEAGEFVDRQVL
ncbi:MAG: hypothetical protein KKI08_14920 [Armatimonadetes bacterium]|nr:hypothetical protein [Armatimonadota bacterium]